MDLLIFLEGFGDFFLKVFVWIGQTIVLMAKIFFPFAIQIVLWIGANPFLFVALAVTPLGVNIYRSRVKRVRHETRETIVTERVIIPMNHGKAPPKLIQRIPDYGDLAKADEVVS